MVGNGWTLKSIEELKAPTNGAIAIGPFGSRMKSDCYVPSGVQVIRGTNISNTRALVGEMVCITPKLADQLGNAIVHADDLVFPHRGSIGLVGIVPRNNVERYALSSSLMKLTCDRKQVEPLFLLYFFRSDDGRHELLKNASTVGTPGIGQPLSSLRSIKVPLPPLAEQKAIAAVLGALDDKIELNRRMNATLEAMARALFQSWFVDFDPVRAKLDGGQPVGLDPGTADLFPASFQDSQLGHIPTDWDVIPLYDTAHWVNGAAFKNEDFCAAGEGLPVIKIAELKDGISAQTKWSHREASADRIIDIGDLVYSWSGSPDTSLEAFLWSGGRGLLNQHIFKVISPTAAEKRFIYYLLQYLRPVLVETARNKQTTGLGHVTIADMKRLLVCMPRKPVLTAFDQIIAPIFDRAFTHTLESRTLVTLRDTLLPRLLSGELRVRETSSWQ
jgi:type I restriction enzyme, S subunit